MVIFKKHKAALLDKLILDKLFELIAYIDEARMMIENSDSNAYKQLKKSILNTLSRSARARMFPFCVTAKKASTAR